MFKEKMEERSARLKKMSDELHLLAESIRFTAIHTVQEDYPELVEAYWKGEISYEDMIKEHSDRQIAEIKKELGLD